MNDKEQRAQAYQKMYEIRRKQRKEGKWNPKLSNLSQMMFSYPPESEKIRIDENASYLNHSFTVNNASRLHSNVSINTDKMSKQSRTISFNPSLSKNIDSVKNRDAQFNIFSENKSPMNNYELKNETFIYEMMGNPNSTKNACAPSEFSFQKNPITPTQSYISSVINNGGGDGDQGYNGEFQFPTPSMSRMMKPIASPSNFGNFQEFLANRQTPGSSIQQ